MTPVQIAFIILFAVVVISFAFVWNKHSWAEYEKLRKEYDALPPHPDDLKDTDDGEH